MFEPDVTPPDGWYLAYTKPRQEELALQNLQQQLFEVYLPLYKKFLKTPEGPVAVFEPMFARYIFFKPGQPGQSIAPVRSTKGINHIVRFGFQLATLGDDLITRIRQLEEMRNHASFQDINKLKTGQKVMLKNTPLGALEAIVQNVSSKRVAVLLEILGRPTVVHLAHHQIDSAQPGA